MSSERFPGKPPEPKKSKEQINIGPGSLLWKYAGDRRHGLTGMSSGILQLMHPEIGTAISKQSNFFEDPWGRVLRSIPEIIGVVYDKDGQKTGERVRNYHTHVKGQDDQGRRYHALNPETYWWPHATFHTMVENIPERFSHRKLSSDEKEQLYKETTVWYERYGVSTKPVPETYSDFRKKWNDICENTLELTPAASKVIDHVNAGAIDRRPDIPSIVWKMGNVPANEMIRILAIGGLPSIVRERFDIPWSKTDQIKLKTIEKSTKLLWPLVPENQRYHSRAKEGMKQAKQVHVYP